jgi:hydroxyethylthiazole kinase-like sugar kinase family protein
MIRHNSCSITPQADPIAEHRHPAVMAVGCAVRSVMAVGCAVRSVMAVGCAVRSAVTV